ncbi:DUF4197 domain-containing protein [Altererythrobacter sp. TH136]|uniref:DUF4197 domain-containing protein n=1 Tax=Altererythrobacter sp. TH136 TaxID=2067415 RepID=UPI0011655F69|nr:DUF4197 domain-containing protein [Altererythrobacter sp. TH136]QDM40256.1 DUF4197 domain-containing protein [Altererythrobacter sp. TH136]
MTDWIDSPTVLHRRKFIAGLGVSAGALMLPACTTGFGGGFSFTDAIARLLYLSTGRAFDRMTSQGGFWDQQVAAIGFDQFLGARGGVLNRILTSALFKDRLADALAPIAFDAAQRAAPVVADTVRTIGYANAIDLIRGGPRAATGFLRQNMGTALIDAMLPGVGSGLRLANDPLVGQALAALSGVDIPQVARNFSARVDDVIWNEIGNEEQAIRANPQATRDPLIIGTFGVGARL